MFLDYSRHVFGLYAGVPNVVREDEDDRSFLVATGAGVVKHGRRREAQAGDLLAESLEKFAASLRSTPPLTRSGAYENLSWTFHKRILCLAGLLSMSYVLTADGLQNISGAEIPISSSCLLVRRAMPLSLAALATVSATAGATRSSKTLGMM